MKRIDINDDPYLRLLVYGKPGSRKSTLMGSAALDIRSAPVLWLDAGGNPSVLAKRYKNPKIHVLELEKLSDLEDTYNWIASGQPINNVFCKVNGLKPPYRTVVFDGFSHVQLMSFNQAQGIEHLAPGALRPKRELQHYDTVNGQMAMIASKFYTLPMHVICSALEHKATRQKVLGSTKMADSYNFFEPLLKGQTLDELPGWAKAVGRMALVAACDQETKLAALAKDTDGVILQFQRTQYVDGKDQHGFPPYMIDPTISQMLDLLPTREEINREVMQSTSN